MLDNVHTPTTGMKKYPINVDIRISGYFIAKQIASKLEGLQLSRTIANTVFPNKNILLRHNCLRLNSS